MSESAAVKPMVTIRTLSVGRTCLNESIALISVSDPPYMFSAVTETRPSAEKISTIAPKPVKTWSPALSSSAMPMRVEALARPRGERGTQAHQPDAPPIAEPQ